MTPQNEATLATDLQPGGLERPDMEKIKEDLDGKFKDMQQMMQMAVVVLLVMVATLVIDAFHFNSTAYSEKTAVFENTQKINQELLDQNRKNQELIIELQKQLLKKKL